MTDLEKLSRRDLLSIGTTTLAATGAMALSGTAALGDSSSSEADSAMQKDDTDGSIHYDVKVMPESHELEVVAQYIGNFANGDHLLIQTPIWVPGHYNFLQYGRDIFSVEATDSKSGAALNVQRDGWSGFRIEKPTGDVTVKYRAYAYDPAFGESMGVLGTTYGVLLGTRYLYCQDFMGKCSVTYELPEKWQGTIHHPSGAKKINDTTWEYPNYEILLDTPVAMGEYDIKTRTIEGAEFYFVFLDQSVGYEDKVDGFIDKVADCAKYFFDMFGSFPFEDYTFIFSCNPDNDWGLEHLSSTMCGLDPDVFCDDTQYNIGVRVCAHEFFHVWNVRRLRPAPLLDLRYHLDNGSFTEGLWVAEGFTRYYEFVSCIAAKVYSIPQFFSNILGYYEHVTMLPAYKRISAADSSYTAYLTHSPKYAGRVNNNVDYYDKGMLIAFDLDAALRSSNNGQNLDKAFSNFYRENVHWPPTDRDQKGYTSQQVFDYFDGIQSGLGAQLTKEAQQPGSLSTESLMAALGFKIERSSVTYLGLLFHGNLTTIYDVADDSPAGKSGIAPGDVIVSINGYARTDAGLKWVAQNEAPVTFSVMRGQSELSFVITPGKRDKVMRLTWQGNDSQREMIAQWLKQDFDIKAGDEIPLDFYENFHGVDNLI